MSENCLTQFHCCFNAFGMITQIELNWIEWQRQLFSFLDIWVSQKWRTWQDKINTTHVHLSDCSITFWTAVCYMPNMLVCVKVIMTITDENLSTLTCISQKARPASYLSAPVFGHWVYHPLSALNYWKSLSSPVKQQTVNLVLGHLQSPPQPQKAQCCCSRARL